MFPPIDRRRWHPSALPFLMIAGLLLAVPAQSAEPRVGLTEAIAAALIDAGIQVAVNVPATGTTELFDAFNDRTGRPRIYSYNEETAYTIAHGAAIGGARSVAILKSHGFAKAANSVIDSIVAGNAAGFLVLVSHDPTGAHSDTVFDTDAFVAGTGIPRIRPAPERAYTEILQAVQTSERLQTPVAVIFDADDLDRQVTLERTPLPPPGRSYQRDIFQYLLCPPLAAYQHRALTARLAGLPPPAERPTLPRVPEGLPPKFKATALSYQPVFDAFKRIRGADAIVAGDTGASVVFAFPPYDCIDITTHYGGSIPLAVGLALAGHRNVWAIAGDFSFVAAAHQGLPEAVQRGLPLKILILHNGVAATTGGQPIQPDVFEQMLGGYAQYVRRLDGTADAATLAGTLEAVRASDRLELVVVDIPPAG